MRGVQGWRGKGGVLTEGAAPKTAYTNKSKSKIICMSFFDQIYAFMHFNNGVVLCMRILEDLQNFTYIHS